MAIINLNYRFRSLQMFVSHTSVFKNTKKGSKTSGFGKIGNRLPIGRILASLCFFWWSLAQAQIQTDGSIGSAQSLSGPDYVIHEELGQRAGNNLFHSFNEFNVHEGESATFTGANEIANVISRVTGGNTSIIDGLLKSEIVDANLYFINPAGVLFGPNASLSINGSFHMSTADYIRLGDTDLFYSEPLQGEILSTAAPRAFGFFGESKGDITVTGSQLDLEDKATLSLVGGNVTIEDDASIRIPQGQINLVGVDSVGETIFDASAGHQDLNAVAFDRLSNVNITNRSELNVDGKGGGRVVIRGGQLVLRDSTISARTTGDANGSGVDITVDHFDLVRSQLDTTTTGSGDSGEILMDTKTLVLNGLGDSDEAGLFANSALDNGQDAVNPGKAGTIKITADQVDVLGEVAIETTAAVPENMGIIDLSTPELTLDGFDAEFQFNEGIGEVIRFTDGNIVLDGSLHPDRDGEILIGETTPTGLNYKITADMGQIAGNNLFHSFRSFFLDEGEMATFSSPDTISNVITRVTGDNATNIYGNLISDIGEANFYFINPNGLFFGPDATLNLSGSFHIGTADYLTLQDGGRFDVSVPDESILSGSELFAYGFKDNEIGEITVEGRLSVNPNKSISLVGGNLQLQDNSRVIANSGQINLVSLQSEGDAFIVNENAELDVSGFSTLGDITIVDDSAANVATSDFDSPVGRIFLRGNDLRLDNNGQLRARNFGKNTGGSIDVNISGNLFVGRDSKINMSGEGPLGQAYIEAENITIDGENAVISISKEKIGGSSNPTEEISESEINLRINAKGSLRVLNGGIINTTTSSSGNAKSMAIRANDLTIDGQGAGFAIIGSAASFEATGNGGNIDIQVTEQLKIINGGQVDASTFSTLGGNGGKATIRAKNLIINDGGRSTSDNIPTGISAISGNNATGTSGEISIYVDEQIQVLNGGIINTSTFGTGDAGSITIQAKNLTIDGQGSDFAGIGSIADSQASGNGGNLDIQVAEQLEIIDGGELNVSTFSTLDGNGGKAIIKAKNLIIDGQDFGFAGISSAAASTGNGGDLDVQVTEQLRIINGGNISASAETGNAGNLSISADENIYIKNSALNISAGQANSDTNNLEDSQLSELRIEAGNSIYIQNSDLSTDAGVEGGDIYLQAPIEIWLENSTLLAQAGLEGGNVFIDPMHYIVINSDVIAQADIQGGNYSVIVSTPNGWIQSTDSLIDLSGEQSGSVLSNTSPFDLGAELSDLETDFLNTEDWVSQPCKFRLGGAGSSFIINGWKGVSNNADDFLPSEPILLADYNLSEEELIDEAYLKKVIFPELNDECEDCP